MGLLRARRPSRRPRENRVVHPNTSKFRVSEFAYSVNLFVASKSPLTALSQSSADVRRAVKNLSHPVHGVPGEAVPGDAPPPAEMPGDGAGGWRGVCETLGSGGRSLGAGRSPALGPVL